MKIDRRWLAGLLVLSGVANAQEKERRLYWESYPNSVQLRIERSEREAQKRLAAIGRDRLEGVVDAARVWKAGSTVTVAFLGGDEALCARLASVADRWTEYGNLKFSFRTPEGKIRRWTNADADYAAHIRVSFDDPEGGFFSLVGTQSVNRTLIKPGERSMNFDGFDKELPQEWEEVVLHEFGHAVGFQHEHQHPTTPCDFRFEDDKDYVLTTDSLGQFIPDSMRRRPGLYTRLGGPPNNWPKATVDFNLAKLKLDSRLFIVGEFDPDSIMKYDFPSWMFKGGENSHCYKMNQRNSVLSKKDKDTMAKAYPKSQQEIQKLEDDLREFKKLQGKDSKP